MRGLNRGQEKAITPTTGAWNFRFKHVANGVRIKNWVVVCMESSINERVLMEFAQKFMDQARNMGMEFLKPPPRPIMNVSPYAVENEMTRIHSDFGGDEELILVVLPSNDHKLAYDNVKRVCETILGVPSQCVKPDKVPKGHPQYIGNVLLKINAKLGGRNQLLVLEALKRVPRVSDSPTCIMGGDVSHSAPGDMGRPSVAAVVGSVDWPCINLYTTSLSVQKKGVEVMENMFSASKNPDGSVQYGGMAREVLQKFMEKTGVAPEKIIFYRDGVGEGQFQIVLNHELAALKRACKSLGFQARITFVLVNKRHHTRFFPKDDNPRDSSGNVMPGTVVDLDIVHPSLYDFYLCSHSGIQGTSRPAHYHVLYDDNDMTPDEIQNLTNAICYTYARCTRSVAVASPAYYAHLAAMRARLWLECDSDARSDSTGGSQLAINLPEMPSIKGKAAEGMFYC